jgi:hypothetical protein
MSTHIAGRVPVAGHEKVVHAWKLWIAAAGIATLTVIGFYLGITRWQNDTQDALMLFGCFVGPSIAAAFGYFWCLPEVLGGVCRDQERTLLQKWSDYALLCSFIGILLVEGSYLRVIWMNFGYISMARAIAILILCPWILTACVVASKEYLSWTISSSASSRTGWQKRARSGMEWCGSRLVRLLRTNVALVVGGGLVLASLVLVESGEIFGPEYKGYEIAAGASTRVSFWDLAGPLRPGALVLLWAHRGTYLLGILLAVLALIAVVAHRSGRRIPGSRIFAALAGILSLQEVTSLAVTWRREDTATPLFVLWLILWAVPIVIWLMSKPSDVESWSRARVAIMVLYLPVFLLWLGFLPFVTYLGIGYGAFVAGMLLMWWGFLQGGREIAERSSQETRGEELSVRAWADSVCELSLNI